MDPVATNGDSSSAWSIASSPGWARDQDDDGNPVDRNLFTVRSHEYGRVFRFKGQVDSSAVIPAVTEMKSRQSYRNLWQ